MKWRVRCILSGIGFGGYFYRFGHRTGLPLSSDSKKFLLYSTVIQMPLGDWFQNVERIQYIFLKLEDINPLDFMVVARTRDPDHCNRGEINAR